MAIFNPNTPNFNPNAVPQQGGGILGNFDFNDPRVAKSLMGLGAGLLQSSGYSNRRVSMGEALGNGLQGAQQGLAQHEQSEQRKTLLDQKREEFEMKKQDRARTKELEANQKEMYAGIYANASPEQRQLIDAEKAGLPDSYIESITPKKPHASIQAALDYQKLPPEQQAAVAAYKGLSRANNTTTIVNEAQQKGDNKYSEEMAKYQVTSYSGFQERGNQARTSLNRINIANKILDGLDTGATAPIEQTLKKIGKSIGVNFDQFNLNDDVGRAEALQALTVNFGLDAAQRTKGPISDKEMQLFMQTAPQLSATPEGNKLIMATLKQMATRERDLSSMAFDFTKNSGGRFDPFAFQEVIDQYDSENQMFDQSAAQALLGSAPQVTAQPQNSREINGVMYMQDENGQWYQQ